MEYIAKNEASMRKVFAELNLENQENLLVRARQFFANQKEAKSEEDFVYDGGIGVYAGVRGDGPRADGQP